jgi:hypothetical protein
MRSIHPFALGHVIGGLLVGAVAGAFLPNPMMVLIGAASLAGCAAVSSAVCWWRPGFEAAAWKLWPVAVLASPLMIAALGYMVGEWECIAGTRRGWNCLGAALAVVVALLCLVPPFGGLLWRWWYRRSVSHADESSSSR